MTSRERVISALTFGAPDRVPRDPWALPAVQMERADEWRELLHEFPPDMTGVTGATYGTSRYHRGMEISQGSYPGPWGFHSKRVPLDATGRKFIDSWGCTWEVSQPGVIGEVKEPLLSDWKNLDDYAVPWELLRDADFSRVEETCASTDQFVRAGTETRPFERMQFLRGSEQVLLDLAYGAPELLKLRDMLHEFFCAEMEAWSRTAVDGIAFMDDWGTQNALLISPSMWRELFKPLYRDYVEIIHSTGKYALFHCDGNITEILPDLVEIGIDAVNAQLFSMNIESIGTRLAGKICFWGEIDRQQVLPFGTEDDVCNAVHRVRKSLELPEGGTIAQCEWGTGDPAGNIRVVYDEWLKPVPVR